MGLKPHRIQVSSLICAKDLLCIGVVLHNFCSSSGRDGEEESDCAHAPPTARVGNRERRRWRTAQSRPADGFRLVIGEMAEPASWSSRQAHWFLSPDESAGLGNRLVGEIAGLQSQERATSWARGALAAKNSLTATDAKLVEDTFERKLLALPSSETDAPSDDDSSVTPPAGSQETVSAKVTAPNQAKGIDKSVLTVAAPRRYRNREHLRYVARQACLVFGRKPSDPHHLGFTQPRALGRKVSDEFAVPLCRGHHRAIAHATNARGGGRPELIRSRLPAGFEKRRADWAGGDPNDWHYLGRGALSTLSSVPYSLLI
jgi:hypothetical protein